MKLEYTYFIDIEKNHIVIGKKRETQYDYDFDSVGVSDDNEYAFINIETEDLHHDIINKINELNQY